MKKLRKIVLLTAFAFAFLYLANRKNDSVAKIQVENHETDFSQDGLHALAFLQPESIHHAISNFKTIDHSVLKQPSLFNFDFKESVKLKARKSFLSQNIDRCEKVSLLLFPFHIFW